MPLGILILVFERTDKMYSKKIICRVTQKEKKLKKKKGNVTFPVRSSIYLVTIVYFRYPLVRAVHSKSRIS